MLGKQLQNVNLNLAGSFAGTKAGEMLNFAANAGLQFAAQGLQLPTRFAEGTAQLLTPGSRADGGFEGLARMNQAAALEQAKNSSNPFLTRVVMGTAAVLSQPAVALEEGILQPVLDVPTKAEKVGVHIHQAMTSSNKVDAAVHLLEATKEGAEVFGNLGGIATGLKSAVQAAEGIGVDQIPFSRPDPSVLSGHGAYISGSGMTTVPKGTSLTTWAGHGQEILDSVGNLVETGQFDKIALSSVEGAKTFLPGAKVPNYTLLPPEGLRILGNPTTVKAPTMLSDLLQPNAGNVQWAA